MGDHVLAGRAGSSCDELTGHAQGQPCPQGSSMLMGEHLGLPYPLFWDCRLEPSHSEPQGLVNLGLTEPMSFL